MKKRDVSDGAWESLCKRCGLCCFEKIEDETGAVFFTATPCQYLDVETNQCSIYERRFELNPECVKLTEKLVRKLHWLHDDCGYRRALGIRRSRVRAERWEERNKTEESPDNDQ